MRPDLPPDYASSPQKPTIYSGPATPTVYDPDWQYFTNLTPAQIAAFQSFPEWSDLVTTHDEWVQQTMISINNSRKSL